MKIMLAQINPRVGDLEGNYEQARWLMQNAKSMTPAGAGAPPDLVVFPELSVMGYPPKDLLDKPAFVSAVLEYSDKWAALSNDKVGMIFGGICKLTDNEVKPLQNVAYLAYDGKIKAKQAKRLLPTYDVFDEDRYFTPAAEINCMQFKGYKLGVSICEDIWNCKTFWKERIYKDDPIETLMVGNPDILINISASPFCLGKPDVRREMLTHIAKRFNKPLVYVNQVGGNDDVIYDGRSLAITAAGTVIEELASFSPFERTIDMGMGVYSKFVELKERSEPEEIFDALVLGTRDYAHKTGFKKVVLGLSGGIDSALVAVIACAAFGPENVLGVGMPSKYSSGGSVSDAEKIASKLCMPFDLIPIKPAHDAYMEMMKPRFNPQNSDVELWEENVQARIRGATLMAISNREGRLLLTTGNKSEVAVGYCTLYGDTCGGLAVISDVFKTKVYDVCRWFNKERGEEIIPEASISKPPSAELRPNQTDQQSLPPYSDLDAILKLYLEHSMEIKEIASVLTSIDMKTISRICRLVDRNEYKRKQLAPGLKITRKAFGTGRQMPIAQGWQ